MHLTQEALNGKNVFILFSCRCRVESVLIMCYFFIIGGTYAMPPDNDVFTGNNPVFLLVNLALRAYDISGAILKTASLNAFSGNPEGASFHRSGVSL